MTKVINWDRLKRNLRATADFPNGMSVAARYRRDAEPYPEPNWLDLTDSRGKPISLPRVSILEKDE